MSRHEKKLLFFSRNLKWVRFKKGGLTYFKCLRDSNGVEKKIPLRNLNFIFVTGGQGCQMAYSQPKILIWVNFGVSCNERCW
jgi:hypothetical protein